MLQKISPASSLHGSVRLPGDKSISHRYALIGALAEGVTQIHNYATGADCQSTLSCLTELGVQIEKAGTKVSIVGRGLESLQQPGRTLDAGNSGSTIRMLSGILAAQPFRSEITGDESLQKRPMQRIMQPLTMMGASIDARDGKFPPLHIDGGRLRGIEYDMPVASAQVKSCVLFAGLHAEGATVVREPLRTRDHTEIALREFGASVCVKGSEVSISGRPRLTGREVRVPGDLSSAAFFLCAASLLPDSRVFIEDVGLNPTRAALLDFLLSAGARIRVLNIEEIAGEPIGTLEVSHAEIRGGIIEKALTASLIDEIPVLAILGAASRDGLDVRDAAELRIKETDRIATLAENLGRMGIDIEVRPDGFTVSGKQKFHAAELDSFGDHRIAMAFSVAALLADGECVIRGAEAASVSFPEFFDTLTALKRG